jgi:hypothetical protein
MPQSLALALTLAVELPLVLLCARRAGWNSGRTALAALLASLATHPIAWWASRQLGAVDYASGAWAIESLVCLAEAGVYAGLLRLRPLPALGLACAANIASMATGFLLWPWWAA